MAFPTGWTRSCKLTIQHGQVPADQTAFPVLITAACLPDEMVTSGGANAAQSDGGDIRFSSDSAGATQLACEIVSFVQNATPSSATAEIWVPVHVLTGSDVDIYVWYSAGGGLSQPAASASFGSQAAWDSNYKLVAHLQSLTVDSTSNANNPSATSVTSVAAKINSGGSFSGASYLKALDVASLQILGDMSMSVWINVTAFASSGNKFVVYYKGYNSSQHGIGYAVYVLNNSGTQNLRAGSFGFGWDEVSWTVSGWNTGDWHHIAGIRRSGAWRVYFDGVEKANNPSGGGARSVISNVYIGGHQDDNAGSALESLSGKLDEPRISDIGRSANWTLTEYNNQNSPTTFVIAGTPSGSGGGGTVIAALMNSYRQRRV